VGPVPGEVRVLRGKPRNRPRRRGWRNRTRITRRIEGNLGARKSGGSWSLRETATSALALAREFCRERTFVVKRIFGDIIPFLASCAASFEQIMLSRLNLRRRLLAQLCVARPGVRSQVTARGISARQTPSEDAEAVSEFSKSGCGKAKSGKPGNGAPMNAHLR
jgi:hypothetical protein